MQLVINTPGAYLHRKDGVFRIKTQEQERDFSAHKVSSILISTAASLSTDAIKLAIEHNIDIIFLDKYGNPYGRVWHCKPCSTTLIRRQQLKIADQSAGLILALTWVKQKITNQVNLLLELRDKRTRRSAEITMAINRLRELIDKITNLSGNIEEQRNGIMGLEGLSSRIYFGIISQLMPEAYTFSGRSRNPAKDEFNCLLNYAYGVLYGIVERSCLLAGLDPYIGLLHTDNYNKKSLVFDLIENYRCWADETVITLFAEEKVCAELFRKLENGLFLEKPGKAILIEALNTYLDKSIRYHHRNIKRRDIVQFDCHSLANLLINNDEDKSATHPALEATIALESHEAE